MNKRLLIPFLALTITGAMANPVRRDTHVDLTQPDGTQVSALLSGDEYMSVYTSVLTGEALVRDAATGYWRAMSDSELAESAEQGRAARVQALNERRNLGGTPTSGPCHLPVVLVQFQDLKFSELGTIDKFQQIFNDTTYTEVAYTASEKDYCTHSVRSYFLDQSLGKFDPTFDIYGPITVSGNLADYGGHQGSAHDKNARGAFKEALDSIAAHGLIPDATIYDGDKDGNADLIYFIFAGYSESSGAGDDYIWPHNSSGLNATIGGINFSHFSCSNELYGKPTNDLALDGIGTVAHEFSHALGLPDYYDVNYTPDCYGMDAYSVMDQGCYCGHGYIPCSYTLHERMMLGWAEPLEMPLTGTVTLHPFSISNEAYMLVNPANPDEYLCFENHQHDGRWDECWAGGVYKRNPSFNGLLITHVDYDANKWNSNRVNTEAGHERCNPLPADGELIPYNQFSNGLISQADWYINYQADIYPGYWNITSLNPETNASCRWYTTDEAGERQPIAIDIKNIEILDNGDLVITLPDPIADGIENIAVQSPSNRLLWRDGQFVIERNGKKWSLSGTKL